MNTRAADVAVHSCTASAFVFPVTFVIVQFFIVTSISFSIFAMSSPEDLSDVDDERLILEDFEYLARSTIFSKRALLFDAIKCKDVRAFKILCIWLTVERKDVTKIREEHSVLHAALQSENVGIIKFLCDKFDLNKDDLREADNCCHPYINIRDYANSFDDLSEESTDFCPYFKTRDLMVYLLETIDFSQSELKDIFTLAAKNDDVWLMRYLVNTGCGHDGEAQQKLKVDPRHNNNEILRAASANGCYSVVKHLHTHFGLTVEDILDKWMGQDALYLAATRGHLDIVRYFFRDMGLASCPQRVNPDTIFIHAGSLGFREREELKQILLEHGCVFKIQPCKTCAQQ